MKKYCRPIQDIFYVIVSIQVAICALICINYLGFQIPLLRQIIGFIYLLFVPGLLILGILNPKKMQPLESILYTVGLSISILFFLGASLNAISPYIGISRPISLIPLISTIVLANICLYFMGTMHGNRNAFYDITKYVRRLPLNPLLFLSLMPFISIFGTYLANYHHNNYLQLLIILIISIIIILIGFDIFFPPILYPFAIYAISISLLFHMSLISMHIWGTDIYTEYALSNVVLKNSFWNPTDPSAVNPMLSIVLLAPIFSIICNTSLVWIFKISYPLLFALVPICLYALIRKQTSDKIAILSCILFISETPFYTTMLQAARQQIAMFFLCLLTLTIVDDKLSKINKSVLYIIFSSSLVVSHYGTSYIAIIFLIMASLLLNAIYHPLILPFIISIKNILKLDSNISRIADEDRIIGLYSILFFVTFALAWYMFIANSEDFNSIVYIGHHIANSIGEDFLNPNNVEGLSVVMFQPIYLSHDVSRYLHLITQLFISMGLFSIITKWAEFKFRSEFLALSLIAFFVCLVSLTTPYTSVALGIGRFYLLMLCFLAPFCIIGCKYFFNEIGKFFRRICSYRFSSRYSQFLSLFLAIFLLFNSGLVSEVLQDGPTDVSLNSTMKYKGPLYNDEENIAARWLGYKMNESRLVYAGAYDKFILKAYVLHWQSIGEIHSDLRILPDSYKYLGSTIARYNGMVNVNRESKGYSTTYVDFRDTIFYNEIILINNKIYDNNGAQIYCLFNP